MAHEYSISDFGLKLIKAYEGFRPVETVLVSGQRVIGYGHHHIAGEASVLTRKKASDLLKSDLEPIEEMVNHTVFAPLSQSQFDALVSLIFNIGAEAFANSNVLHYLNNGQPLAAAAGFDEWRKSVVVDKTYVIDALVRRRTAEKALFLSPATGVVAAPRNELPPLNDSTVRSGADDIEVFNKTDAGGYVDQTPYSVAPQHSRRKDDNPSGILTLSERVEGEYIDEAPWLDGDETQAIEDVTVDAPKKSSGKKLSPIAVAAAEVSERLDNLMADEPSRDTVEYPSFEDVKRSQLNRPNLTLVEDKEEIIDIDISSERVLNSPDEIISDASNDIVNDAATVIEAEVERQIPDTSNNLSENAPSGIGAYWTVLLVGLTLLGGGLWKLKFSPAYKLDEISAFLAPVAMLVGAMMILGGLYYLIKSGLRNA